MNKNKIGLRISIILVFTVFNSLGQSKTESSHQIKNNFSTNLPLVIINTNNQYIPDEPKIKAYMGIIDNDSINKITDPFNGYDGIIGIEKRGQTSQNFSKKSYAVETRNNDGSSLNVSLLGLPEENDWVLYGPYSDKSLIRNVLAYSFSAATSQYAPRTKLCEVFIDEEYKGIYVLTEKIKRDKNRVDIAKLKTSENTGEDLTGGYIIKIDKGEDPGWYSPYQSNNNLDLYFQYHYPKPDSITPEQKNYISHFVTEFETTLLNDEFKNGISNYSNYIDVQSFVDFLLVNELTRNPDGLRLSSYFYKDKDRDGLVSPLVMGPIWDFNLAFGNIDFDVAHEADGWLHMQNFGPPHHGQDHPFWWRKLMSDPVFNNLFVDFWKQYRETIWSDNSINQMIDSLTQLLDEPKDRNFEAYQILGNYVWPNYFVGDTYQQEINYLKNWIFGRVAWIDSNVEYKEVGVVDYAENIAFEVYPNPFIQYLNVSFVANQESASELKIYNMLGKVIFAKEYTVVMGLNNIQIGESELYEYMQRPGAYVLQLDFLNGKTIEEILIKQ